MARPDLFSDICTLAGPALEPLDPGTGWPGIARVSLSTGQRLVALHVSKVSSHARAEYERRFQNPASGAKVRADNGAMPILVGLGYAGNQPILVAVDGSTRVNRATRFSILFNISAMQEAALTGWSEYHSSTGERIIAMRPRLLPAYIEAVAENVLIDAGSVGDAALAAGLLENDDDESGERVRATVTRLVRRAAFGREVCVAYANRCAVCGIGLDLLEGAHIYPATAPGSPDKVWNGLALCRNHHRLFDRHKLWISPTDRRVLLHPEIHQAAVNEAVVASLVTHTRGIIALPSLSRHHPRSYMFTQRYDMASALYEWAA